MESIIRNVRDTDATERQMLEHVLGKKLREHEQIIFQIVTPASEAAKTPATPPVQAGLPDWCNVFEGLTDAEVADLDAILQQRAALTRSAE